MLQRQYLPFNQGYGFQHKLQKSQQQLEPDFYQLIQLKDQIKRNKISQVQCSNILQEMIQKMTHPTVGIQLLKDRFIELNFFDNTGFKPFQAIQYKAQAIYVEMILGDLKKMQSQLPLQTFSHDEVKNIIQQINWKIGMEKSIHESRVQEVGEHVDLMKFFQGVRNYQNWHQNIKRQTIEQLKHKAHDVQLKLTLKKGFIISKIQNLKNKYEQYHERQFISKCKDITKIFKIQKACKKIQFNHQKQAFSTIYQTSTELKQSQKVGILLDRYWKTKICPRINKQFLQFTRTNLRNKLFIKKIEGVYKGKNNIVYAKFLQKVNFSRKIKSSNVVLGLQRIQKLIQRRQKHFAINKLNIPQYSFFRLLNRVVLQVLNTGFKQINKQSNSNMVVQPQISYRMKGKILSSLRTAQQRPIDIRNTFLNWYVKGNQTKFSKQIYNIWLTGTTSKFAFFMRLKNLINQNRNYKIKYQLKLFLMVFNQRINQYYGHCQKQILRKWVVNSRRIRKIQKSCSTLQVIQSQTDDTSRKYAFAKILHTCKENVLLHKLCLKFVNRHIANAKTVVDTWKILPDLKRSKGQIVMRRLVRNIIQQIVQKKIQSFNTFRANKILGKDKKVLFLRKAFSQDALYLQRYFQIWRIKKNDLIKQQNHFQSKKAKTLLLLQKYQSNINQKNLKDVLRKFSKQSLSKKNRELNTKKVFISILKRNEKLNTSQIMLIFKGCWQQGNKKKDNLVKSLVESNKQKQNLALLMLKNKSKQLHNLQKIKRTQQFFALSQIRLRKSFSIYDKSTFVFAFLNKILVNRANNISTAFRSVQSLPSRINWKKKDNAIKLYETLGHFYKRNKGYAYNKYKRQSLAGRFKMAKSMDIMAAKYFDVTRRYFNMYRKNVNRIKNDEINKSIGVSFENTNQVFTNNFKMLFIGQAQWKKKSDHFIKLNQRIKGRIGQAFKLWRQTSKSMAYFNQIQNQKKKRYIQVLMKTLSKNQVHQTRKTISLFKKNSKITEIQLAFLKRLCDSQAGKVVKAVMIWKNIPEPKNKEKIAKATKFQSTISKIAMKNFRKSFVSFKDGQYFGNERKKYCIRQLVAKSSSGLKSYFQSWRGNSKLSIVFGQCQKVSHMIDISHHVAQFNFGLLFEGNQARQKRQKLHDLQLILCQQKKQLLSLWRQKTRNIKQYNQKKTNLLMELVKIQQNTVSKNVRDLAIKKFIQLKILKKIQKQRAKESKLLQVIDNVNKKRKQNISESLQVFKFNLYKGNFKKKRAFQNWIKDKIRHINDAIGSWNDLAKQTVMAEKRKLISHNFESMDQMVKANFAHLISNRKQMELKKKMLNNLFRTQQLKLKGYLLLWKNNSKQLKMLSELDKQAKSSILERINKIVSIGSDQSVKNAITKFHQSMKIQFIQKKFINQLLKTKSGLVLDAVNKWKSIPAINLGERYKKAQKFFFKLQHLQKAHLGLVYSAFKKESEEGNLIKKQSILQLFDMTSTGIRRYYRRWQKSAKERHTLKSVYELMRSLEVMNQAVRSQYMIVFQDQRDYTIKTKAINKLILAAQGTAQNYFNKWRQNNRIIKFQKSMDNQKRTLALQMFTRAIQGSEKSQVIDTIRKFKHNSVVTEVSKKFFNRLLQTKTGKLVQFFEKMKGIPDTKVAAKKKKAIKFQGAINKFAMKILRSSFNPFKTSNFVAIDRKKYCINKLIRISMGQQQKTFMRWRNLSREDKILSHSNLAESIFSNMQGSLSNGLQNLFRGHKEQVQKKKNLCRKLVMNSQFVQHHAFMIWKEAQREDDIKIVKRQSKVKDILKSFINIHSDHQKKSAVGGFGQFRNLLILKQMQNVASRQKQKHTKAYQFIEVLQKFKRTRTSPFIQACKASTVEVTFTNRISALETVFKNSSDVCAQNLLMLMRNQRQSIIIENALNRIFANFKVGTEKAFSIWRENARVIKFQQRMGNQKKKNILDLLNKLIINGQSANIKKALQLFNINYKQQKIQKQILMKLMNCKAGKVPYMFMKWKGLPSQTGKKYKQRAMKFQTALFRTFNQRIKFVYQNFKHQSFSATVKKQFSIKKLISVTQSDSTRIFNKWRKVNNQTKITQKLLVMDKVFTSSQDIFMKNIQIFTNFKQNNNVKTNALRNMFLVQQVHLKDSLSRWIQQNKRYKIERVTSALKKYTQEQLYKVFVRQGFASIKQRFQIQNMKGYINSLWKWKMSNTETNYYSKFIKIFSQSQELLTLSKLLNKKQSDTLHFAFNQIQMSSKQRYDRKVHLVNKYLSKKIRTYFQRMRINVYKEQISTWRGKYTQSIRVQQFSNALSQITRRIQNDGLSAIKGNQKYIQKAIKLTQIIELYRNKNIEQSFKNMYKSGYFKIIKISLDSRIKVKQHLCSQAFDSIVNFSNINHFNCKIDNVQRKSQIRRVFHTLRKNSERLAKQKLSLLLLSQKVTKKQNQKSAIVLNAFRRRALKSISTKKLSQTLERKLLQQKKMFFQIDQNDVKIVNLLQKFKKGTAVKNILEKQDKKILKAYFGRLKKKQNVWIGESVRKFATRSSLRSSMAISLWRLKSYAQN